MKILLYSCLSVFILYVLLFAYLSFLSAKNSQPGLAAGKLKACPNTPNCVCSEYQNGAWFIQPFAFEEPAENAWSRIKTIIINSGGKIQQATDGYIWATFRTRIFKFTDDVEFRLDSDNRIIHVRSASRVGKGDLGANRKRIENLRLLFNAGNK